MLIPNYPEAFLKGANISIGMDNNNFQVDSRILEYKSITGQIIENIFPPKYRHLSSSMYTLAGVFTFPILFFGFLYEIGGKIADKQRMRRLGKESGIYRYGFNAVEEIVKEAELVKNEKIKIQLYNELTKYGLSMEKSDFENLFNNVVVFRQEEQATDL